MMEELSDFEITRVVGDCLTGKVFGLVTIITTEGMWWWKKIRSERRVIVRGIRSTNWYYLDTGKFTPGFVVEELERAYNAQQMLSNKKAR